MFPLTNETQNSSNWQDGIGQLEDIQIMTARGPVPTKRSVATGRIWLGPDKSPSFQQAGWYDPNNMAAGPGDASVPGGVDLMDFRGGVKRMRSRATGAWYLPDGAQGPNWYHPDTVPDQVMVGGQMQARTPQDRLAEAPRLTTLRRVGQWFKDIGEAGSTNVRGLGKLGVALGRGAMSVAGRPDAHADEDLAAIRAFKRSLGVVRDTHAVVSPYVNTTDYLRAIDPDLQTLDYGKGYTEDQILAAMASPSNPGSLTAKAQNLFSPSSLVRNLAHAVAGDGRDESMRVLSGVTSGSTGATTQIENFKSLLSQLPRDAQGLIRKESALPLIQAMRDTVAQLGTGHGDVADLGLAYKRNQARLMAELGVSPDKLSDDIKASMSQTPEEQAFAKDMAHPTASVAPTVIPLIEMALANRLVAGVAPNLGAGVAEELASGGALARRLASTVRGGTQSLAGMKLASAPGAMEQALVGELSGNDPGAVSRASVHQMVSAPLDYLFGTTAGNTFGKTLRSPINQSVGNVLNKLLVRPAMLGAASGLTTSVANRITGQEDKGLAHNMGEGVVNFGLLEAMMNAKGLAKGFTPHGLEVSKRETGMLKGLGVGGPDGLKSAELQNVLAMAPHIEKSIAEIPVKEAQLEAKRKALNAMGRASADPDVLAKASEEITKLEDEIKTAKANLANRSEDGITLEAIQGLLHRGNIAMGEEGHITPYGSSRVKTEKPKTVKVKTASGTAEVTAPGDVADKAAQAMAAPKGNASAQADIDALRAAVAAEDAATKPAEPVKPFESTGDPELDSLMQNAPVNHPEIPEGSAQKVSAPKVETPTNREATDKAARFYTPKDLLAYTSHLQTAQQYINAARTDPAVTRSQRYLEAIDRVLNIRDREGLPLDMRQWANDLLESQPSVVKPSKSAGTKTIGGTPRRGEDSDLEFGRRLQQALNADDTKALHALREEMLAAGDKARVAQVDELLSGMEADVAGLREDGTPETPEEAFRMTVPHGKPKLKVDRTSPDAPWWNKEEPPADGMKRLYRVEPVKGDDRRSEWLKSQQQASGHVDAEGRWFTDDPSTLAFYEQDAGNDRAKFGQMRYIDVPEGQAEKFRVKNLPSDHSAKAFSRDQQTGFFLPKEVAESALPEGEKAPGAPTLEEKVAESRKSLGTQKRIEGIKDPIAPEDMKSLWAYNFTRNGETFTTPGRIRAFARELKNIFESGRIPQHPALQAGLHRLVREAEMLSDATEGAHLVSAEAKMAGPGPKGTLKKGLDPTDPRHAETMLDWAKSIQSRAHDILVGTNQVPRAPMTEGNSKVIDRNRFNQTGRRGFEKVVTPRNMGELDNQIASSLQKVHGEDFRMAVEHARKLALAKRAGEATEPPQTGVHSHKAVGAGLSMDPEAQQALLAHDRKAMHEAVSKHYAASVSRLMSGLKTEWEALQQEAPMSDGHAARVKALDERIARAEAEHGVSMHEGAKAHQALQEKRISRIKEEHADRLSDGEKVYPSTSTEPVQDIATLESKAAKLKDAKTRTDAVMEKPLDQLTEADMRPSPNYHWMENETPGYLADGLDTVALREDGRVHRTLVPAPREGTGTIPPTQAQQLHERSTRPADGGDVMETRTPQGNTYDAKAHVGSLVETLDSLGQPKRKGDTWSNQVRYHGRAKREQIAGAREDAHYAALEKLGMPARELDLFREKADQIPALLASRNPEDHALARQLIGIGKRIKAKHATKEYREAFLQAGQDMANEAKAEGASMARNVESNSLLNELDAAGKKTTNHDKEVTVPAEVGQKLKARIAAAGDAHAEARKATDARDLAERELSAEKNNTNPENTRSHWEMTVETPAVEQAFLKVTGRLPKTDGGHEGIAGRKGLMQVLEWLNNGKGQNQAELADAYRQAKRKILEGLAGQIDIDRLTAEPHPGDDTAAPDASFTARLKMAGLDLPFRPSRVVIQGEPAGTLRRAAEDAGLPGFHPSVPERLLRSRHLSEKLENESETNRGIKTNAQTGRTDNLIEDAAMAHGAERAEEGLRQAHEEAKAAARKTLTDNPGMVELLWKSGVLRKEHLRLRSEEAEAPRLAVYRLQSALGEAGKTDALLKIRAALKKVNAEEVVPTSTDPETLTRVRSAEFDDHWFGTEAGVERPTEPNTVGEWRTLGDNPEGRGAMGGIIAKRRAQAVLEALGGREGVDKLAEGLPAEQAGPLRDALGGVEEMAKFTAREQEIADAYRESGSRLGGELTVLGNKPGEAYRWTHGELNDLLGEKPEALANWSDFQSQVKEGSRFGETDLSNETNQDATDKAPAVHQNTKTDSTSLPGKSMTQGARANVEKTLDQMTPKDTAQALNDAEADLRREWEANTKASEAEAKPYAPTMDDVVTRALEDVMDTKGESGPMAGTFAERVLQLRDLTSRRADRVSASHAEALERAAFELEQEGHASPSSSEIVDRALERLRQTMGIPDDMTLPVMGLKRDLVLADWKRRGLGLLARSYEAHLTEVKGQVKAAMGDALDLWQANGLIKATALSNMPEHVAKVWTEAVESYLRLNGRANEKGFVDGAKGIDLAEQAFQRKLGQLTHEGRKLTVVERGMLRDQFRSDLRDAAELIDLQRQVSHHGKALDEFFGALDPNILLQFQMRMADATKGDRNVSAFDRVNNEVLLYRNRLQTLAGVAGLIDATMTRAEVKASFEARRQTADAIVHEATHFLMSYLNPGRGVAMVENFKAAREEWLARPENEKLSILRDWLGGDGAIRSREVMKDSTSFAELLKALDPEEALRAEQTKNGLVYKMTVGDETHVFAVEQPDGTVKVTWPATGSTYRWSDASEFVAEGFRSLLSKSADLRWAKELTDAMGGNEGQTVAGGNLMAQVIDLVDGTGSILQATTLAAHASRKTGLKSLVSSKGEIVEGQTRTLLERMGDKRLGDIPADRDAYGRDRWIQGQVRDLLVDALGESREFDPTRRLVVETARGIRYADVGDAGRKELRSRNEAAENFPARFLAQDEALQDEGRFAYMADPNGYTRKVNPDGDAIGRNQELRDPWWKEFWKNGVKAVGVRTGQAYTRQRGLGEGVTSSVLKAAQQTVCSKAGISAATKAVMNEADARLKAYGTDAALKLFGDSLGLQRVAGSSPQVSDAVTPVESILAGEGTKTLRKAVQKAVKPQMKAKTAGLHEVEVKLPDEKAPRKVWVAVNGDGKMEGFVTERVRDAYRYLEMRGEGDYRTLTKLDKGHLDELGRRMDEINERWWSLLQADPENNREAIARWEAGTKGRKNQAGEPIRYIAHLYGVNGVMDTTSFGTDAMMPTSKGMHGQGRFKERTFTTIDDAIQAGFLPKYYNPAMQYMQGIHEQMTVAVHADTMRKLIDQGLAVWADPKVAGSLAKNWTQIENGRFNDQVAEVFGFDRALIASQGRRAEWKAEEASLKGLSGEELEKKLAQLDEGKPRLYIHNSLASFYNSQFGPGLGSSKAFQSYQHLAGMLNGGQLLGPFHATTVGGLFNGIWRMPELLATGKRYAIDKAMQTFHKDFDPKGNAYAEFRQRGHSEEEARQLADAAVAQMAELSALAKAGTEQQRLLAEHGVKGIDAITEDPNLTPQEKVLLVAQLLGSLTSGRSAMLESTGKTMMQQDAAAIAQASKVGAVPHIARWLMHGGYRGIQALQANVMGGIVAPTKLAAFSREVSRLVAESGVDMSNPDWHRDVIKQMTDTEGVMFKNINQLADRADDVFGLANFNKMALDPSLKGLLQMTERAYTWHKGNLRILAHALDEGASLTSRGIGKAFGGADAYGRVKEAFGGKRMMDGEKAYGLRFVTSHIAASMAINTLLSLVGVAALGSTGEDDETLKQKIMRRLYLRIGDPKNPKLDQDGVPYYASYGYTHEWAEALQHPSALGTWLLTSGKNPNIELTKNVAKTLLPGNPVAQSDAKDEVRRAQNAEFERSGARMKRSLDNLWFPAKTPGHTDESASETLQRWFGENGSEEAIALAFKRMSRAGVQLAMEPVPMTLSTFNRMGKTMKATPWQKLMGIAGLRVANQDSRDWLAQYGEETED